MADAASAQARSAGARRVAVVFPAQHLRDGGGAAEVLRQQHAWIETHGYEGRLVVVAPSLSLSPKRRVKQEAAAMAAGRELGFSDVTLVGMGWRTPTRWPGIMRLGAAVRRREWSLETDLAISDAVATERIETGSRPKPDFVICNYLSGLSTANRLAPPQRQLLVLHDWMDGPPPPRIAAILHENRQRLALNADEAQRITSVAPERPCLVGLPVIADAAEGLQSFAPDGDIASAIVASGPQWQPTALTPARTDAETVIDLLFVGGAHPPNQAGITAFVRDCFAPHLSQHGVSLVIAGAVGGMLDLAPAPGLSILGRVRDLAPLYASARLVIVPLLEGTGVSIKTLEAIGLGRPVLSTPIGLRGLGVDAATALEPPFDQRWADRIIALLGDPGLRTQLWRSHQASVCGHSLGAALSAAMQALPR